MKKIILDGDAEMPKKWRTKKVNVNIHYIDNKKTHFMSLIYREK